MKKLILLIVAMAVYSTIYSQVDNIGHLSNPLWYVGWNSLSNDELNIVHESPKAINFYTNAGVPWANMRMRILGTNGFVGIGNNLPTYTPAFYLDVFNEINVNYNNIWPIFALGTGYNIGGKMVFQVPGIGNSFIGINTGTAWTSGQDNTFIGENAGQSNTSGNFNTFIGSNAGAANDIEEWNTYVGNLAGQSTNGYSNSFFGHHTGTNAASGNNNTFLGSHAGFGNSSNPAFGQDNTFVGVRAGEDYVSASDNTLVGNLAGESIYSGGENAFLGNLAGRNNTLGSKNTFVGFRSGQFNIDGTRITLIGHQAYAQSIPSITNAAAIGASAFVMTDNSMILGDLNVNVGLGLSGNASGPNNKLEINDNINNGSGLRFRQLTAADPATFIPNGRVLTVDGFGDVVLTTDIGGTGSVSACVTAVPADQNFITKWDIINTSGVREICRTNGIFESPTGINSVGIGGRIIS